MKMKLAENIRMFRKQKKLTQEQLAEALGVTVGAVYKWEAELSLPELHTIMELADFFDTSVDVLLGYEMRDNRLQATTERLKRYCDEKDRTGLAEAEKALQKYPNSFDIVYRSAVLYTMFGIEKKEKPLLNRALKLLESSRLRLVQNTDPQISEATIYGKMATVLLNLGEAHQAVSLLQKHNVGGMYDDVIGQILAADSKRPDEALPFLSKALLSHTVALINTVIGYVNVYFEKKEYDSASAILCWTSEMLYGLKEGEQVGFFDKINCVLLILLAATQLRLGDTQKADDTLLQARRLAEQFDASPCYRLQSVRFAADAEHAAAYDDLGATAMESIQKTLRSLEDAALNTMWEEQKRHEEIK